MMLLIRSGDWTVSVVYSIFSSPETRSKNREDESQWKQADNIRLLATGSGSTSFRACDRPFPCVRGWVKHVCQPLPGLCKQHPFASIVALHLLRSFYLPLVSY